MTEREGCVEIGTLNVPISTHPRFSGPVTTASTDFLSVAGLKLTGCEEGSGHSTH